jgi:hypothetical protein
MLSMKDSKMQLHKVNSSDGSISRNTKSINLAKSIGEISEWESRKDNYNVMKQLELA